MFSYISNTLTLIVSKSIKVLVFKIVLKPFFSIIFILPKIGIPVFGIWSTNSS